MKKTYLLIALMTISMIELDAQIDIGYQKPHKDILDLVDVSLAPSVQMDSKAKNMLFLYRDQFKTIQELSEKELRLAGLRINPATNISSRASYFNKITVRHANSDKELAIAGLPKQLRLSNFSWSPDETKIALTNTTEKGVELWIVDINNLQAKRLTTDNLNANLGRPYLWFRDSKHLLIKVLPQDKSPLRSVENSIPAGPIISENTEGTKAQNRTYQDLLKNKDDEFNFIQLTRAELHQVDLEGNAKLWKSADLYRGMSFSPDGNYLRLSTIKEPFSYIVPFGRFPYEVDIYTKNGEKLLAFDTVPLVEELPKGFMSVRKGKRDIAWRSDEPATLYWAEALDEGDPQKEVSHRDAVYEVAAPFTDTPRKIFETIDRFYDIDWGDDNTAIVTDYWWNTRNTRAYLINPSNPKQEERLIYDRNYQDRYNSPGGFVTEKNKYGREVLALDKGNAYLIGEGFTPEGQRPFVDKMNLKTFEKERLWQANNEKQLESIVMDIDIKKGVVLTRVESPTDYPNYYIRHIGKKKKIEALTDFKNPFESMKGIKKEMIKYEREDGVELSGILYLPADYDNKKKLPLIMWAYPREYKDKSSAGQVSSDPNEFIYPWYGSPVFWVMRGYAVLDEAAFPIVGEGEEQPNDSFIKQLVGNAAAAIDVLDKRGIIDRERVAIGGHSYGAFMTANLLSHSDLFAAGIARSGAYNRTLTPFGFQSEERSYWDAPEIYYQMSPFMHADKMKTPLLLIHGEADNNSGTYPMQSERYFNALKGLGAPVRLVMLPKESHGYAAKESILHVLWEQDQWLEKHVKNKAPKP